MRRLLGMNKRGVVMLDFFRIARGRWFCMCRGWGRPRFRGVKKFAWWVGHWLGLDAVWFAVRCVWWLRSAKFNRWCDEVDHLFSELYDWPGLFTVDCGREEFLESWLRGTPARWEVDEQASYFQIGEE